MVGGIGVQVTGHIHLTRAAFGLAAHGLAALAAGIMRRDIGGGNFYSFGFTITNNWLL